MIRGDLGLVAGDLFRGEALQLVGEDQPVLGRVDEIVGRPVGAVVAGLEEDRGDADVAGACCAGTGGAGSR